MNVWMPLVCERVREVSACTASEEHVCKPVSRIVFRCSLPLSSLPYTRIFGSHMICFLFLAEVCIAYIFFPLSTACSDTHATHQLLLIMDSYHSQSSFIHSGAGGFFIIY